MILAFLALAIGFSLALFGSGGSRRNAAMTAVNEQGRGVSSISLDGKTMPDGETRIPLLNDGATQKIEIVLGS